jgi:glucose-6-phosphate 1-dehydrogenase
VQGVVQDTNDDRTVAKRSHVNEMIIETFGTEGRGGYFDSV